MQNGNSTNGSDQNSTNGTVRIGFFICHCGVNISSIVNVLFHRATADAEF